MRTYPLFTLLLLLGGLAACTNENTYLLQKAQHLLLSQPDSSRLYLAHIDTSELSASQRQDYHIMNLSCNHPHNLYRQPNIDRRTRVWAEAYPPSHPLHSQAQKLRLNLLTSTGRIHGSDSMLNSLKAEWTSDSLLHTDWLLYKISLKMKLGQTDSAAHYIDQLERTGQRMDELYEWQASLQLQQGDTMTAVASLQNAIYHSTDLPKSKQYIDRIISLLQNGSYYQKALQALRDYRQWMLRVDLPSYIYTKGELHRLSHRPDSAIHYYRIAQSGGDLYVNYLAAERLYEMNPIKMSGEMRLYTEQKLLNLFNSLLTVPTARKEEEMFEKIKMMYEINQLKMSRQRYFILLICLLLVTVTTGTVVSLIWLNRRKKHAQQRLQQENLLLRQQEEIARLRMNESELRAQAASIREELLRRIKISEKLPLLPADDKADTPHGTRIHLSDEDWRDLQAMVNSTYRQFTQRLREQYPALTDKDIQFCCLLKVNMNLQTLADIYCISKTSVSKKKLRLKEKLGLTDAGNTLDEWIQVY